MESHEQKPAEWIGLTWGAMADRVHKRIQVSARKSKEHGDAARRWQARAVPLAWATAVFAALSGLTVVTEQQVLAGVLSVATAILAATNAALNPTATARLHRVASNAYEKMERKFEDFSYVYTERTEDLVPLDKRKELFDHLHELDTELDAIEQS